MSGVAPPVVLASASPRRSHLLSALGIPHDIAAADLVEHPVPGETPEAMVVRLASEKASAVAEERPAGGVGELTIGGDTVVVLDGRVLGKPADEDEAMAMLTALSGRRHLVYSGLALITPDGDVVSGHAKTEVLFRSASEEELKDYVRTGEPMDKAGAYGIQGIGASLVAAVSGDYTTVVGFPIPLFLEMLNEAGFAFRAGRGVVGRSRSHSGEDP